MTIQGSNKVAGTSIARSYYSLKIPIFQANIFQQMRQAPLAGVCLEGIFMERLSTPPRRGRPPKSEADNLAKTIADRVRRELSKDDNANEVMDCSTLANFLRCSPSMIRNEISRQNRGQGRLGLPFFRMGRAVRFLKTDIDRWLAELASAAENRG